MIGYRKIKNIHIGATLLLGATATDSKSNFIQWVDKVVTSVATEHCKVYLLSGVRDHGNFANLTSEQFTASSASLRHGSRT